MQDTWRGQFAALFLALAGGGLSLVYLYFVYGLAVATEEVRFVLAAIVGAIGGLFLLFLFNLAAAPYRILRDERDAALEQVAHLSVATVESFAHDFLDLRITQ